MIEVFILSVVQGITEFLPISSSAHLILISKYFSFNNANLALDISLHFGSLLAIIFYYKTKLRIFIINTNFIIKILFTSIPLILSGFILIKLNYIDFLRSFEMIGWMTIVFAIIMFFSDLKKTNKNITENFDFKSVIIIGVLQVFSLIPGVSRSGITITAARLLNFNRINSAEISFLTSIPVLAVISIYNLQKILLYNYNESSINFIAVVMSFIFSYLTIKFFLDFLKKFNLLFFVIYRLILGVIILYYVYN